MPLTDAELKKLEAAPSEAVWNTICDEIKDARGGEYASDWHAKVLASGMARRKVIAWAERRA